MIFVRISVFQDRVRGTWFFRELRNFINLVFDADGCFEFMISDCSCGHEKMGSVIPNAVVVACRFSHRYGHVRIESWIQELLALMRLFC